MHKKQFFVDHLIPIILGVVTSIVLGIEMIMNFTPPISRDALIHHLALPKLWCLYGLGFDMPWANFSYFPMNIDLIYYLCLLCHNDVLPKFIHLGFGIATALVIYLYLKPRTSTSWSIFGGFIFITIPIIIWLSTVAYVDLGMIFFTTTSLITFTEWREGRYQKKRWFYISAVSIGLALGCKYNALIPFFFMICTLCYCYAKDQHASWPAICYGCLYILIAGIMVSPWYIKNALETGNPLYPLLHHFFNSNQNTDSPAVNFFMIRHLLYNESICETLLIPFRMFFQGNDASYQYFQGELNPLLIIFLPFAIMNKSKRDSIVFCVYSFCIIWVTFYTSYQQVRYIAPVLPILSIVAVYGIQTCHEFLQKPGKIWIVIRIGLWIVIIALLSNNIGYLKDHFSKIDPLPYIMNQETKDDYLNRHLSHYSMYSYINSHIPEQSNIFLVFLGRRSYYLDRAFRYENGFGMKLLSELVNHSETEDLFTQFMADFPSTHMLMRDSLAMKYLTDNFQPDVLDRFKKQFNKHFELVQKIQDYALWKVKTHQIASQQ